MGTTNRATGTDRVAIQVGRVTGRASGEKPAPPAAADTTEWTVTNHVQGNAKVGRQVDTITGDLTF